MFIDTARITVKAGNGGNGAATFHREKYIANGGPDGGDGGRGGNIVFQTDSNLSTLADFKYKRKYAAENGQNGSGGRCAGKKGQDTIIKVPIGTVLRDAESGRIIADLSDDQPFIAAHGGKGGWGNQHFATPTRQIPKFAKDGNPGEVLDLQLELKLLADVGLLGFPNVGKSTLISVVSSARPNIANYHFTTITPVLGVVSIDEETSFVMADIPGVIEGASEGVGLGHEFLRHVERCRLLVHVVDVSGSEGRDPIADFETINRELKQFNEQMSHTPQIVAGNKIDMASDEQIENFRRYVEERGFEFFPMSAAIAEGTRPLINRIAERLQELPPIVRYEAEAAPEADFTAQGNQEFEIRRRAADFYEVIADWIIPLMDKTNPNDYDQMQYFQRVLTLSGIIDGLKAAGVKNGDTVSLYDFEFDYIE